MSMVRRYSDEMLCLVFAIFSLVGSSVGYPPGNGEVSVGFNLADFLANLSIPFFGFGFNGEHLDEEPDSEIFAADEENPDSEEDSSGAEVNSFAEAGVGANGNVFANADAAATVQQDDSDEGFALFSFSGTVIQTVGDDVSMDSFAGSQIFEEDGDQATSFSVASVDVDDDGITASSNTLSEAFDNVAQNANNGETQSPPT